MNKIFFKTFGCRVNQAETALLKEAFLSEGCNCTESLAKADIAVINTCALTKNSEQDLKLFINKTIKTNPKIKIALIGCLSELKKEAFFEFPNVKWVVGNEKKLELAQLIADSKNNQDYLLTPEIKATDFEINLIGKDAKTRAHLKIQDGCNEFCSYCIVPYVRGPIKSRDFENIISCYEQLLAENYKEIIITGINVGKYFNQNKNLFDLLDVLLRLNQISRIRLSSIEPNTIDLKKMIDLFNNYPNLCRFLHIPLQSGSTKILRLMNRKYTLEKFQELILTLHKTVPNLAIGTDVIVGFPEETDTDFQETYEFLKNLPLSYLHVFSYSERPGTKSNDLKTKIPVAVIKKRSQILRNLSLKKKQAFIETQLYLEKNVLFEEKKTDLWVGYTDNYLKIGVHSELDLKNKLDKVKLVKAQDKFILAELLTI